MKAGRIRAFALCLVMLASIGVSEAWRPTVKLADQRPKIELDTLFPQRFGEWVLDTRGPVQLVSPDAQAVIDRIYSQTLTRVYVRPNGDRIMLSVAYGGDQSDATRAHRPEVCYPAQGFQVSQARQTIVPTAQGELRLRQIVARQGNRNEPISYYVIVGDKHTLTGTEQKLAQMSYTMRGAIPDGMLVRVSNIDSDNERAYAVQAQFLQDLSSSLAPAARLRIMGS